MSAIPDQGKVCTKCGKWKYYDQYHAESRRADGRRAACKECRAKYLKSRYQARKGIMLLKKKQYRRTGKGHKKVLADELWYRAFNREKLRERARKYYQENRGKRIAQVIAYKKRKKSAQEELAS